MRQDPCVLILRLKMKLAPRSGANFIITHNIGTQGYFVQCPKVVTTLGFHFSITRTFHKKHVTVREGKIEY